MNCLGEEGLKVIKNMEDAGKPAAPASTIAEVAVDQLQASEKLIAGLLYNPTEFYFLTRKKAE